MSTMSKILSGKSSRGTRSRLQPEERRQSILDAARSLFISKGYAGVSVDEIVRIAGGSKSAVYQLFGGKEGLLAAVTESLAARMLSEMTTARTSGKNVRHSLQTMGRNLIGLILSDDAITQYRLAINNLTVNPALSALWYYRGPSSTFDGFAKYLKQEVAAGRLRIRDCQRAADQFLGMIMCRQNIAMSIGEPAPSRKEMEQLVSDAVDVFLAAYGA